MDPYFHTFSDIIGDSHLIGAHFLVLIYSDQTISAIVSVLLPPSGLMLKR